MNDLSWVNTFYKSSETERRKFKKMLLEGIAKFPGSGQDLYNALTNPRMTEFVGFMSNIEYFKEKGIPEDLHAKWVHPFGGPTLVYHYKNAPALIIASPSLRYNDSFLNDTHKNEKMSSIIGITD